MATRTKKATAARTGKATKTKTKASTPEKQSKASTTAKARALARKKAKALNISVEKLALTDMVRAVQRAEGNFDCFGTAVLYCDQDTCCWRFVCLTA